MTYVEIDGTFYMNRNAMHVGGLTNLCCFFCIVSEARGERTKPQNEGGNAEGGGEEGNSLLSLRLPLPLISLSHKLFQFCFCFCVFVFFSHPAPVLESPCNFLGANPNINEY